MVHITLGKRTSVKYIDGKMWYRWNAFLTKAEANSYANALKRANKSTKKEYMPLKTVIYPHKPLIGSMIFVVYADRAFGKRPKKW